MADIITPRDLPNEMTTVTDQTVSEVYNPSTGRNERVLKDTDRTYFQGTLPALISGNTSAISTMMLFSVLVRFRPRLRSYHPGAPGR